MDPRASTLRPPAEMKGNFWRPNLSLLPTRPPLVIQRLLRGSPSCVEADSQFQIPFHAPLRYTISAAS